ncbi:NlpC/P60 family protein [Arthrobacter sp. TMS2-4]
MSTCSSPGRHRAPRNISPLSGLSAAVASNAGSVGRQAAVIVAVSGLVLTSGVAANAADVKPQRDVRVSNVSLPSARTAVVASNTTEVSFARTPVRVKAKPVVAPKAPVQKAPVVAAPVEKAPVVEAPVPAAPVVAAPVAEVPAPAVAAPAVEVPAPAVAAPPVVAAPAAPAAVAAPAVAAPIAAPAAPIAPAPVAKTRTATAVPASTPAPAPSSGVAATIAAAARGQLGVVQDCTRLASNSLAAAGINFHGWPAGYLSLGRTVSAGEAIPGDLIYYADGGMGAAHIAVYIGGGQAVHGGFNGNTTVIAPAELGSGGVYIRVGG